MAAPMYNVFVGAETGLLKGITLKKSQWNNLNAIASADREKEICAMCWDNTDESKVCFGLKNRQVLVYDVDAQSVEDEIHTFDGGSGKFRALAKVEGKYLTAVESGLVKLWDDDEDKNSIEIEAGKDLFCMEQNPQKSHIIGTGGKENELKLWDLQRHSEPIFKAKNVKNDWLNLRVPVWVMGVQFLPGSDKVVTSTGHHQVRVYDPQSSQRRPVLDIEVDEYPLTAISLRYDQDNQVLVGNTQGKMALVDLRNGKVMQVYKGFAGGIRDIKCHPSKPLVASCGLDRHIRIHDIDSREMVNKLYLKSRLNCLLFSSREGENATVNKSEVQKEADVESGIESEDEDVWENLELVKTKTVKKKEKEIVVKEDKVDRKRKKKKKSDKPKEVPMIAKKRK
ncbi:WD repeat-containing protein 74-like [Haliotis rubra]|uniref:WD repeat-containing protein 74-like n=1 Tax=Haliotis rubra TaxID=36100 RepID=UPI001EE51AEC|nr:WD repeat-containing protein 74-like [Haliotis rubra]